MLQNCPVWCMIKKILSFISSLSDELKPNGLSSFSLQISLEEIHQNSLKWQIYQTLKRGQIVGARMAGASVTKTAELFGFTRSTISKVIKIFEKEGKISLLKQNSWRKRKLFARDRRTLTRIVRKDYKKKASKITAELNDYLENPISSKTVRKKHLILALFFQLLTMEKALWWSEVWWGLYLGNLPTQWFLFKSQDNLKILSYQIHPMVVELFPEENTIFQDDNAPIHAATIVSV